MLGFVAIDVFLQELQAAREVARLIGREAQHGVRGRDTQRRDRNQAQRKHDGIFSEEGRKPPLVKSRRLWLRTHWPGLDRLS